MNNQINLTVEEREELELMLTSSPSLKIAHELKEELIAIYNSDITPSGGMRKMKKWLISARVLLPSAARVNALKFYIIKNACKTKVDLIY